MKKQTEWSHRSPHGVLCAALTLLLIVGTLKAAPSPIGTGLLSNITLGALQDPSVIPSPSNQSYWIYYDVDLNSWRYDVYVPPTYDGTKPFGVVVYISSNTTGAVLSTAATDKNLIWISPRNVDNNADPGNRFGASLLALYRAKELFNIDPRRVYTSGLSGGARVASALAFFHPEVIHGTAPSSGICIPRLNAVTPDYIPRTGVDTDSYFDYSSLYFDLNYFYTYDAVAAYNATAKADKLRSYLLTRYDDHREDWIVEAFHCAYEPQGDTTFLYDGPGTHQDATDAEMEEAIDYLDRDDIFPVNANVTAGAGGFSGMTSISQSGATAVEATSGGSTTFTLTPTLSAVAATKTGSTFYWDNTNGSTIRWLWEVKNAAPTNQKTCFGLWFANETWGGGAPVSVTAGGNPGILITITQNGSQNRMVISARPDSGGEVVFYDGTFIFVQAYSTAWTSTQTGYLTGTGSPVEIRMDLNKRRWQLTFNGIALSTTNSIANGTQVSRDNKRLIFGYWDSALGTSFWKHDAYTAWNNTWSPFTKSIFTTATGAISSTGSTPAAMDLRYVIASDPNLPAPLPPGPDTVYATGTNGAVRLSWTASTGATSYNVKRSGTSGTGYTTIATGTALNYIDTAVTNGATYYYVVSAQTASGESINSPEVRATPDSNSLIANLRFDEGSGTTASDSTGHGWNGALVNGAGWSAGKINNALSLTGTSSQYVSLPTGILKGVTDCTISAWVKLTTVSTWARVFDFGTGTSNYMFLTPQNGSNSKVRFAITSSGNGNEQKIDGTSGIPAGVWTHVAVTISGSTGTLYVNGTVSGTNNAMTLNPASLGNSNQNYIGKSQWADPYLNGAIDEFCIYSRALSATEIAAIALPPAAPTGLTASGSNAQVALSWTASLGATSYSVKRSGTSGGAYTTIASTATTSYTDTGLAAGATYYYVVSALNGAGESANSAQANATTYTAVEAWRQAYFGTTANTGNAADTADPDGDGMTNAQEFIAGTKPNDRSSVLKISQTQASGNDMVVSFPTAVGKTYRVDRSDTLQSNSWTAVQSGIAGTGAVVQVTDTNGALQQKRFYRIVVQ